MENQLNATEPQKKKLWQGIVRSKIENQAECLKICKKAEQSRELTVLRDRVLSGDKDNIEALAAQIYFRALFGSGFTRSTDNGINAALNYCYAIIRGSIARQLAVYGFLPALGIHHKSTLNSFNLADDLMEPFRPLADLLVSTSFDEDEPLTPANKRILFNCLNLEILSGGQKHSVSYAVERLIQSLGRSLEDRENKLYLPKLLELKQHSYE